MNQPDADMLDFVTSSPAQTEQCGERLAALLPAGAVVALYGELATGKTCFVRGMASFFAGDEPIHSPTFTLVNEYGREKKLYHLDLYRLARPEDVLALGCEELFEPDGVCVVEWADRAQDVLPPVRVDVFFEHRGGDLRALRILNRGALPPFWKSSLRD